MSTDRNTGERSSARYELIASLYAANPIQLLEDALMVFEAGIRHFHIDIMDGIFVPAIGLNPRVIAHFKEKMPGVHLHVHFMTISVTEQVQRAIEAGADSITFHIEATHHAYRVLQMIRTQGVVAGLALNPGTPAFVLESLFPVLDQVLVMTTNPGYSDEHFIAATLAKVAAIRQLAPDLRIIVDGDINQDNIAHAQQAGADWFVCGRSIFQHDPHVNIQNLNRLLYQASMGFGIDGK